MKIDETGFQLGQVNGASPVRRTQAAFDLFAAYGVTRAVGPDQAQVSQMGQEVQRLTEQVKQMPDIREAKVQDVEQRLREGTYQVPVSDLTEAMFRLAELDSDNV